MSAAPVIQESGQDAILEKKLQEIKLENGAAPTPPAVASSSQTPSGTTSIQEKPVGPQKTPIPFPLESSFTAIPTPPELTAEQQSKYEALLETVKSWKKVPSTKGKGGPITENEIFWMTRECLLRYLRATKWNTAEAEKRLLGTLTWRREYGVEELTSDHVGIESETGKQFIVGWDIAARPCHYLNPGRQNTEPSPRQVQHLVFMLERVIDLMVPGQETLALLINFKSSKTRTNTAPGIGQGREVLNILQTHYPERLGRALIINIPWIVNGFFKLITPFIDPLTRLKLKFNDDMRQHVPPSQLWNEFHGDMDFEYDHEVYWPALLKLANERYEERHERWVKAGKHYGESEIYLKGGNAPSVYQERTVTEPAEVVASEEKEQDGAAPIVETSASEGSKEPIQSNGNQSSGNKDVMAVVPDHVFTTEGDKA